MNRRQFLQTSTAAGLGFSISRAVLGANDRVSVAIMGVNGRGSALARSFAAAKNAAVVHICDVDRRAVEKTIAMDGIGKARGVSDFRRALDDESVDALVIAAPDHWHAPATVLALQAGKHVYVEKPLGHNPREGEILVAAEAKYGRIVQMGNQQRSHAASIEAIEAIRSGIIGRPYFARAWYANTRGSIGRGQNAPVPNWLDYELWQGPAPRTPYRDNVVHYNWHWFWTWGTGEICNNGTHEIDVCRWALGVDFPVRVASSGGRYHFDDDWEAFDTQVASFDFENGTSITWEGRSCNGRPIEGRSRGASIHGENGTVVIGREGYEIYDRDERELKRAVDPHGDDGLDTRGGGGMTDAHVANFVNSVRGVETPRSPVSDAHPSVLLCHLGNIAQRVGRSLACDPQSGRIESDPEAMALWSRTYEPGFQPNV